MWQELYSAIGISHFFKFNYRMACKGQYLPVNTHKLFSIAQQTLCLTAEI